jgi:hypothetical protein
VPGGHFLFEDYMAKSTDTSNIPVGQPADIILADGSIGYAQTIEPVDMAQLNKDYLEALRFNEDILEIMIHESTNPNDENPVTVGNNGQTVTLDRGKPYRIKRKFVDSLIVKNTLVSTPEYTNNGGERAFKITQRSAMKYPFEVRNDPSPKGREWLNRRMAEVI